MSLDILFDLLAKIHFYYPVGLPYAYKGYPGYKSIEKIVSDKIDQSDLLTERLWTELVKKLKNSFSAYKVNDLRYLQFPSYVLEIELENQLSESFKRNISLILSISLLSKYYTVFINDTWQVSVEGGFGLDKDPEVRRFVYNKSTNKRILIESVEFVISQIDKVYQDYTFLPHKDLFEYKVFGCGTYGKMDDFLADNPRSIYDFLFNNDMISISEIRY